LEHRIVIGAVGVCDPDAVEWNAEALRDAAAVDHVDDFPAACLDHGDVGRVVAKLFRKDLLAGASGLAPRPDHHAQVAGGECRTRVGTSPQP
jgi:hypothetical protein